MTQKVKNMRKVWVRPFLSEILGLPSRSISYRFGLMGRIQPKKVRDFIREHGYDWGKEKK